MKEWQGVKQLQFPLGVNSGLQLGVLVVNFDAG